MSTELRTKDIDNRKISARTLKRKFKSDRKKAIYYVKEQTGWKLEESVDYVYDLYDNDPIFKKKDNFFLDIILTIIDEFIMSFLPHRF